MGGVTSAAAARTRARRSGTTGTGATGRAPQQDRSRATRLRLLQAAIESLAEIGYQGSTVAVVARRAGVSRGAAQHHFPTREELFLAAVEHVAAVRRDELEHDFAALPGRPDTDRVVSLVFSLFSGQLFRAALALWTAAANEPALRGRVVPLEARIGREIHRVVVTLLHVDEHRPGVRETVQATLDLARGLGLANLLTDDSRRRDRIAAQWSRVLTSTLAGD